MNSLLGVVELPLAILMWFAVVFVGSVSVLTLIIFVSDSISKYKQHKQQLRWDQMTRGVRR